MSPSCIAKISLRSLAVFAAGLAVAVSQAAPKPVDPKDPVSYYKQIRPIFQAQCQGCHQPAKAKGDLVMTDVAKLMAAGASGKKAVIPGKPDASYLIEQIIPVDGKAEMPRENPPLATMEIDLIRKWIAEGAKDDTPKNAVQRIDATHPPEYKRPPTITSLDYSPDGKLLAVSGFHEVVLHKADGSGMVGRLVGLSERIETVRFSPDGKFLAVAGGLPARMGEVQIWDVEKRKLTLSVPVTYDTVYGVSWSPDGKLVAFGCSDKTVRAVEVSNGKQVLQQMSHNDWVLDTVFSTNGSHVVSTGRDMSAKLTETATQRFVDNITSITPGALRGGLHSVARHPTKDEVLIGGSDGIPQIYVLFRKAARKIGDNANLVRRFPAMEGRIFGVGYSHDGNRIVAGSSFDGRGTVNIYAAAFDSTIPTNILKAYEKVASTYSPEEKEAIEKFLTQDIKLIASASFDVAIYSVSFSPDGKTVAAGGEDGWVRLLDAETGKLAKEFVPVPVPKQLAQRQKTATR